MNSWVMEDDNIGQDPGLSFKFRLYHSTEWLPRGGELGRMKREVLLTHSSLPVVWKGFVGTGLFWSVTLVL